MVVATGDSVTSSHWQKTYSYPAGNCANSTSADTRGLPGNDMNFSYVGKYVANNANVVEYYNFARTGFGTHEMRFADPQTQDACRNDWARDSSPTDLAAGAIKQAKNEKKSAYFVTTGGVNNTYWTGVLAAIAECGTMDYYRDLVQQYIAKNRLPWEAEMRWYNVAHQIVAKSAVINGGSCQLRVKGDVTGIRYLHARIPIPVYDGPIHFQDIQNDVNAIATQMLDAGADKVVWMGYYDISPARWDVGLFGETFRQQISQRLNGLLPGQVPSQERDLIDDPGWKTTVQQWTQQLNTTIRAALPNNATFQPAPALTANDIQKTALGGCPHPNDPGQTKLSQALATAFG